MEMKVNRELIKALRVNKSWSQERLAEVAGVSLRTVQRVENEGAASLQTRVAIADALGVEPAYFDAEVKRAVNSHVSVKLRMRLLLSLSRRWGNSALRGAGILLTSLIGVSMLAIALFKPFKPNNVGLFTTDTSVSFGMLENTVSMQEHLGYWVIPLACIVAWGSYKGLMLLIGTRVKV